MARLIYIRLCMCVPWQAGRNPLAVALLMGRCEVAKALAERVGDVDECVDLGRSVELSGATGPRAEAINGVYEPTPELSQGQVEFVKKGMAMGSGVGEMALHCSPEGSWVVYPSSETPGVMTAWADVACEAGARPEQCTGAWRVGGEEQASVRASAVGVSVGRGCHVAKCLSLLDHACLLACLLVCVCVGVCVCVCWCVLSGRETLVARGAGEGAGGGGGGAGGERGQGHRQGQGESSAPTVVPQVLGVLSLTFVEFGVQFDE